MSDSKFPASPKFLTKVKDSIVKGFAKEVHKVWNLLIRSTNTAELCAAGTCESSLIPLNHTFVVPGGRFREQCEFFLEDSFPQSSRELILDSKKTIGIVISSLKDFCFPSCMMSSDLHLRTLWMSWNNSGSFLMVDGSTTSTVVNPHSSFPYVFLHGTLL